MSDKGTEIAAMLAPIVEDLGLELLGIDTLDRLPDLAPLLPDVDSIDEEF